VSLTDLLAIATEKQQNTNTVCTLESLDCVKIEVSSHYIPLDVARNHTGKNKQEQDTDTGIQCDKID
jgi:hypothetical protein